MYFHGRLFADSPQLRGMFPASMDGHAGRLLRAITRTIWSLDCPPALDAHLTALGRDHRKFGVVAEHYPAVCDAFMATIRVFLADAWTTEMQDAWQATLGQISRVMIKAAEDDAAGAPPWWVGEVVGHDRRGPDVAVLSVLPSQPLPYRAGQYVSVQCTRWPRIWRRFSIANAPATGGVLRFHVRAVPGGWVSRALVHHTEPGDMLLLGPAAGTMTADTGSGRDVLCVAGGTGLAPIKAIVEQLIADSRAGPEGVRRNIYLFFGARRETGLYDLRALRRMESGHPALTVIPVVSDEPEFGGLCGTLPDVVGRYTPRPDHDVYVSGPARMVRKTTEVLTAMGTPVTRIHNDPAGTDE
ncbi:MAG TPA: globin domain-containing protein [Streptosporangiaceae bacterium]|nr:globin domain-containing protein [Streptosporangiaceae bacterium]